MLISRPTTTISTPTTARMIAYSSQMPTIVFQRSAMGAGLRVRELGAGVGAIGLGTGSHGRRRAADRIGHVVILDRIGEGAFGALSDRTEFAPGDRPDLVDMGEDRVDFDQTLAQLAQRIVRQLVAERIRAGGAE